MLSKLFQSTSPRLVTNLSEVGSPVNGSQDVNHHEYDFVIIGGGNTGCALAARLSEDSSVRVLVLEAGGRQVPDVFPATSRLTICSGKSLLFTRIPVAFSLLFRSKHVYQLYTEPQVYAGKQKKFWPRAKMLGGCSSLNAQMAQFGAPQDFDEWGKIIDDEAWSWKNLSKYFNKFQKYEPDPRYPDVKKETTGPVRVGYFSYLADFSRDFIQACAKVGVPISQDFNTSAGTRGVNRVMTYIDQNRTRVSSETAYFTNEVLARSNLTVAINATVTGILFEKDGGETRAVGVEFANSKEGPRFTARAKKEVILSAGSIHSPHILLLSGVGPADHLKDKGVIVIRDLPGIGSNLVDHPVVDLYFKDKNRNSIKHVRPHSIWEVFKLIHSTYEYLVHQRGPLACSIGEGVAFIRSDDPKIFSEKDFPEKVKDSTSGDDAPDLEIFSTPLAYKEHAKFMFPMRSVSIHACLLRPLSKGVLCLKSNNPFDLPSVDPKYLSAPEDIEKLRRGLRFILNVVKQEPLTNQVDLKYEHELLDSDRDKASDAELEDIIRTRVETLYHPAGTCRMAPESDNGVVDSHLRVYGIKGLRVADASIFPKIVSGHTAGACYAIAEHFADILKAEYSLKSSG